MTFTIEADTENRTDKDQILFDGQLRLGSGAKILAGTRIEPPVYLAEDARVLSEVTIGKYSYIGRGSIVIRTNIGRYCSIGHDCQINYFRNHPTDWLSTHPFQFDRKIFAFWPEYSEFTKEHFDWEASQRHVTIEHDSWIGAAVFIFQGITIGLGSIVGARSTVIKSTPRFSISYGSPAETKRFRFDEATQGYIIESEWWDKPPDAIQAHRERIRDSLARTERRCDESHSR